MGLVLDSASSPQLPPSVTRLVGTPGADVNMWGITKLTRDKWGRCDYVAEDGTRPRVWSLRELSVEEIRNRWGAGDYRIQWFIEDPENEEPSKRLRAAGTGPQFGIDEVDVPRAVVPSPAAPSVPAASSLPAGLGQALELMAVFDARASQQLERTMTAAAAMGRGGGLDAQTLVLLMQNQQTQTERLVAAMQTQHTESMNALRAQLAALRSELESDDEDDEERPGVANLAAAAATPFLRKGQSLKSALFNYAAENPAEVFSVLRSVPEMMAEFVKLQAPAPPPPAAPAPSAVQRPRARVVTVERPLSPGLNTLLQQQPAVPVESAPSTPAAPVSGDDESKAAAAE